MTNLDGLEFSNMGPRDLRAILEIENTLFPEPWSRAIFESELAQRASRCYRVARIEGLLVGYLGLMFVEDECHVMTLGVRAQFQRQGVGIRLMLDGIGNARTRGAKHLSLEVAVGNESAQALYRRFGFAPVGVRKGYYQASGKDALVMWAYDIDSKEYQHRLESIVSALRTNHE